MKLIYFAPFALFFSLACEGVLDGASENGDGDADNDNDADNDQEPSGPVGVPRPVLDSLRNTDPIFSRHQNDSKTAIAALGFAHDDFTDPARGGDNGPGPGGQGQFRLYCQWSHFGYDDPIVLPRSAGSSHLHMFWGNTRTNAFTVFSENPGENNLVDRGGSTCQGFELNRSAYWIPALLNREQSPRKVIIPRAIILYYKSHRPSEVHPLPAGVQFLAGNVTAGANVGESFEHSHALRWACGGSGTDYNHQAQIPTNCNPGETMINAAIEFPQCLKLAADGSPVLSSPDFVSHAAIVDSQSPCPASHPYRVPQITYLVYWPYGENEAGNDGSGVANWVLSSDRPGGVHGGSLHGDWLGGWNEETIQTWIDGCFDPNQPYKFSGPRNCSGGQTGPAGQGRGLRLFNGTGDYGGPFLRDLPE